MLSLGLCAWLSCSMLSPNDETGNEGQLTVAVLNVGQGLSQIAEKEHKAVVWDMADTNMFMQWYDGYVTLGCPHIEAIFISHGDRDHTGGMHQLPASIDFSGLVITSPYEDTAALRAYATHWSASIRFRTLAQADTVSLLPGLNIECLWPPFPLLQPQDSVLLKTPNRRSACFKVRYGYNTFLITSDIDTVAAEALVLRYGFELASDFLVIPHHGSRGSLHPLLYGYANPEVAIISCGMYNPYNHPSDEVVRFLAIQMNIRLFDTRFDGHVFGRSNGEYWMWDPL